jgi:hypothetical protein
MTMSIPDENCASESDSSELDDQNEMVFTEMVPASMDSIENIYNQPLSFYL